MSGSLTRIEIKFSRVKLLVPLALFSFFMVVCLYFFFNPETDSEDTRQYATWLVRALSAVFVVAFFVGARSMFRQLISSKPALILDSEGITDNSSDLSPGFIKWSDIEEVLQRRVNGARVISLRVVDDIDISVPNLELATKTFRAVHALGGESENISDTALVVAKESGTTKQWNTLSGEENIVDIYAEDLSSDFESLYEDIFNFHNQQKTSTK